MGLYGGSLTLRRILPRRSHCDIGATAEASYRLYRQVGGMLGKTAIAAPHMHTCEIYLPDKFCNMYATCPEALFNVLVRIFKYN